MIARDATDDERTRWDDLILSNPDGGNVFSSDEYLEQKRHTAYRPHHIMVDDLAVSVLEKDTGPLGRFWYLPKGPNTDDARSTLETLQALAPLARKRHAFMIRIETELPLNTRTELEAAGMTRAAPIIPNASTITLPITADPDELLMNLPQKGRHAIRRAERDGVTVAQVETTDANCQRMYDLLSETAEGQFGIRSFDYYKTYWQRFAAAGIGQLFFATFEGRVVAAAYAMVFGRKSTYKDGASVRDRPTYGASHLLQWSVIQWAHSRGAVIHDLCGSPPSDRLQDTTHPHYGVGRFKLAFSKDVHDFIGCEDFILGPLRYKLWVRIGERIARRLYFKKTRDYYY